MLTSKCNRGMAWEPLAPRDKMRLIPCPTPTSGGPLRPALLLLGTFRTSDCRCVMSVVGGIVLQKSFAGSVKNSEGRWRVLRVMIRGTSSPCAKFMGDFGSATEAVRIIDLFALQVFAKNFDRSLR